MYGDAIEEEDEGDSGKSRDMLLFRHFKMMLHNKEVGIKVVYQSAQKSLIVLFLSKTYRRDD